MKVVLWTLAAIAVLFVVGLFLPDPPSEPAPTFQAATADQVARISAFLEDGLRIQNAHQQRSGSGYFVAAEIANAGGYVGVWWHGGSPEDPGMTLAVDSTADEACVCPWARETRANISENDARELKTFVEKIARR